MVEHAAAQTIGERDARRVLAWLATPLIVALLTLSAATSAWGAFSVSATRAPIGHGSYLITVTNTGATPISSFLIAVDEATNIRSSAACSPVGGAIACSGPLAAGASAQVCYSGLAPKMVLLGLSQGVKLTGAPRTSCPLAGFKPAAVAPSATGSAPASVHPWKRSRCIAEYKAWKKKHKAAKARQRRVERGKLHKLHGCPLSILK